MNWGVLGAVLSAFVGGFTLGRAIDSITEENRRHKYEKTMEKRRQNIAEGRQWWEDE